MKVREIAALLGGAVVGDGEVEISGVKGISEAGPGDITYLAGAKLLDGLKVSPASAVIVKEPIEALNRPQITAPNPQLAFARLLGRFYVKPLQPRGVSEKAFVAASASIGDRVTVYPFAYIGDYAVIGSNTTVFPGVFIGERSRVGDDCLIYPNVTIREDVTVGNRVIVHAGTVIGADGFGYVFDEGEHHKIPQVGSVTIEDDVEIGANVTIDRATTGSTVIGRGTKIDNLVQVAHNVRVGRAVILVAQVGIGGSSSVGDGAVLGGQVGVADHTTIQSGTMIGAQSGIKGEVKRGAYFGSPALPLKESLKVHAVMSRLPELKKRIEELERQLGRLERKED